MTMILHVNSQNDTKKFKLEQYEGLTFVQRRLLWLARVAQHGEEIAQQSNNFCIFGTAIAGTWLGGLLGERVKFFVDEDPLRAGKTHIGHPVLPPNEVPPGSCVYLALTPLVAKQVYERLRKSQPLIRWIMPPQI
jgi:hypothetical protein